MRRRRWSRSTLSACSTWCPPLGDAAQLRQRNRGHIVNFGSAAGVYPLLGEPFYAATKAGVHMFCQNLRMDLFGTDIRVSEILPGRVASGMHAELVGGNKELGHRQFYEPYECLEPADVANAVLYLASDESQYLTGIELTIDGGILAGSVAAPKA